MSVKKFFYYASLICPIVDICKGFAMGIYDGIKQATSEYEELKKKSVEEIIAHKSVLNKQRFEKDN